MHIFSFSWKEEEDRPRLWAFSLFSFFGLDYVHLTRKGKEEVVDATASTFSFYPRGTEGRERRKATGGN